MFEDEYGNAYYQPFGFMITPTFYPFTGKLEPPERLRGEWIWEPPE